MKTLKHLSLMALIMFCFVVHFSMAGAEEKWPGVDKTVVEKFAKEHGRETKASLINTDQGDLLLFVFLIAGATGGFAAGYYWRALMERSPKKGKGPGGNAV